MKNLQAFKDLIETYKNITKEDIEEAVFNFFLPVSGNDILNVLTGFGNINDCILCDSVDQDCNECLHSIYKAKKNESHCPCAYRKSYTHLHKFVYRKPSDVDKLMKFINNRVLYLQEIVDYYEQNKC